jgi:hypothetical protein
MVLFVFALVVALVGLGAFDLYNPDRRDVAMAGHHFVALSVWVPVALGAAVPLSLFLLHALWTSVRIGLLKRGARMPAPAVVRPAVAPRRPAVARPAPARPAAAPPPVAWPPSGSRRRRASQAPSPPPGPQPAPKRSWLPPHD